MKAALAISLLVLAALTAFRFQDELWPIEEAHLSRVDADFSSIGAAVKAYKMKVESCPTQQGMEASAALSNRRLPSGEKTEAASPAFRDEED